MWEEGEEEDWGGLKAVAWIGQEVERLIARSINQSIVMRWDGIVLVVEIDADADIID